VILIFEYLMWYIRSDIELVTTTVWGIDRKERIDGFYFRSKRPFSNAYQWHGTLSLLSTYPLIKSMDKAIKNKRNLSFVINSGLGREKVTIWKGSMKRARELMFEMVKKLQEQY